MQNKLFSLAIAAILLHSMPAHSQSASARAKKCIPVRHLVNFKGDEVPEANIRNAKGLSLTYLNCDKAIRSGYVTRYVLHIFKSKELVFERTYKGKNPKFDEKAIEYLHNLSTGDEVVIDNIHAVEEDKLERSMASMSIMVPKGKQTQSNASDGTLTTAIISESDINNKQKSAAFLKAIMDKVKSGKIKAYSSTNNINSGKSLTVNDIGKVFSPGYDTITVEDVDGSMVKKIAKKDFNYDAVTSFKVAKQSAKGEMNDGKIIAVAPLYNIYNDAGQNKNHKTLFWVRYQDIQNEIQRFNSDKSGSDFTNIVNTAFRKGGSSKLK